MNRKNFKFTNFKLVIIINCLLPIIFSGCTWINSNEKNLPDTTVADYRKIDKAYDKAKIIFYSLPSPVETMTVLEASGAKYNEELLNPVKNALKYNTSKSQALNLGIYSADLSYTILHEQNQSSINYMAVSKKIADNLGVLEAINDSTITQIKDNMQDKNKVMNIISESFIKSSAYLEENDRSDIAAMVILGGWMEGLYISVNLAGKSIKNNPDLVSMIVDQRLSLEDLIGLLELYKDNKDIALLLNEMKELKGIYDKLGDPITQKEFDLLANKVNDIRNGYIQ